MLCHKGCGSFPLNSNKSHALFSVILAQSKLSIHIYVLLRYHKVWNIKFLNADVCRREGGGSIASDNCWGYIHIFVPARLISFENSPYNN